MKKNTMKNTKIIAVVMILAIAGAGAILAHSTSQQSLTARLKSWNLDSAGLEGFEIQKTVHLTYPGSDKIQITAVKGAEIVMAARLDAAPEIAKTYTEEKQFGIESLYKSVLSTYPDVITKTIECPAEFMPKYHENITALQETRYYLLYASERLTYGVCSADLVRHRALFALVYCRQTQKLLSLEVFAEPGSDDALARTADSLRCLAG